MDFGNDSSQLSGSVLVTKLDVPVYLQSGDFYISLNDEDKYQIAVPGNTLKMDKVINSNSDLLHLLLSLRFWGVSEISTEVIAYCITRNSTEQSEVILQDFAREFRYVDVLLKMLQADQKMRTFLAVSSGILELVQALRAENCDLSEGCQQAAKSGHAHILRYLHEQGGRLNKFVFLDALAGGSVACVEYLRSQGLAWPHNALAWSLVHGSTDCFHLARSSGCQWNYSASRDLCSDDRHADQLRFAIQYGNY